MPRKASTPSSGSTIFSTKTFSLLIQVFGLLVAGGVAWGVVSSKSEQTEKSIVQLTEDNKRQDSEIDRIDIRDAEQNIILQNIVKQLDKISEQTKLLPQLQADIGVLKEKSQ